MAIADLCYVDDTGYHFPDYPTVLAFLQDEYRNIYGDDVYIEPDSQDGQWIAVNALAIYDCLALGASVYNSFSPATAQGVGLSRNVKINGIARAVATYSQADLTIIGQPGTLIENGQAEDILGQKWNLPTSVLIPLSGEIIVTATSEVLGAVTAGADTINRIGTPTLGWQTVNNVLAAVPGAPVETDAELRLRQSNSTALPSLTVLEGTIGAVKAIAGVGRVRGYENDSNVTDADGIPAHNIAIVAESGDGQAIADAIARKKTPGTPTFGTTSFVSYDKYGVPNTINFFRPTVAAIGVEITITALPGFTTGYSDVIKQKVLEYIKSLNIGQDVYRYRLATPANMNGTVIGETFEIDLIRLKKDAGAFGLNDIAIAFNEVANSELSDISIIIV
jgi:uncharacterized phage protein gp47/JayE